VDWHGIPFFHIPVTAATKPQAEARLLEIVDELDVELVVLARYMQVLSDDLARKLDGRAINIHHSFLPSFKGAKPSQAHGAFRPVRRRSYPRGFWLLLRRPERSRDSRRDDPAKRPHSPHERGA
jgi:hypothetical protein